MKFKDAEIVGRPVIVVVGRGYANGLVEVRHRATGDVSEVPVGELVATLGS